MNKIFVVLSDELLEDGEWHTDTCRAFATKKDATKFARELSKLFTDESIDTVFYVKEVAFGNVEVAA